MSQVNFVEVEQVQCGFIDWSKCQIVVRFGIAPDAQDNPACKGFAQVGVTKRLRETGGTA
jgi:hypothetical protein